MYPSVKAVYPTFTSKFEGKTPYMYLDNKGLVTTGIGNLIDPVTTALRLPWKNADGSLASPDQIQSAWNTVKGHQEDKLKGGGAFAQYTTIRLDEQGISDLVNGKMDSNEAILVKRFPGYPNWPAPAQLALHSMAWAMGANFNYPKFQGFVNAISPDFRNAASESYIPDNPDKDPMKPPTSNPGLRPRNDANKQLFLDAAASLDQGLPLDQLAWPLTVDQAVAAGGQVATIVAKSWFGKLWIGSVIASGAAIAVYGVQKWAESMKGKR